MESYEAKPFSLEAFIEQAGERLNRKDVRLMTMSSVIESAQKLVEVLDNHQRPDSTRTIFEMYENVFHDAYIPEALADGRLMVDYLDTVRITQTSSTEDPSTPATTIDFDVTSRPPDYWHCSPTEKKAYDAILEESTISAHTSQLSRDQSTLQATDYPKDAKKPEQNIDIPQYQIRKCIIGLLSPEEAPIIADVDVLDDEIHYAITQKMKDIASWYQSEDTYILRDSNGDEIGQVRVVWNSDKLSEVNVYSIINTKLGVSDDGKIIDQQRATAATIITEPNKLDVELYYTDGPTGTIGRSEDAVPYHDDDQPSSSSDAQDEEQELLLNLLEFMNEQIDSYKGDMQLESLNEDNDDYPIEEQ